MCLKYIPIKPKFNQNVLDLCILVINIQLIFLFSIQQYLNDAYKQTTLLIQQIY